jgi:hypothetical protein
VSEFVQVVYFFGPAYATDVSLILAARLFPTFNAQTNGGSTFCGRSLRGAQNTRRGLLLDGAAVAFVSFIHAPPFVVVRAVLPPVFIGGIAATTIFWLLGLKQSWI